MKSMEFNHEHNNTSNNIASGVLLFLGWLMDCMKDITVSDALSIMFQMLSILSVSLIIVINFPKAMRVLFPKNYKKKEDADKH